MKKEIKSESLLKRRLRKFKRIKRGYFSLIVLLSLYIISFFEPLLINNKALYVSYKNKSYFPVFKFYGQKVFGQSKSIYTETNYRKLKRDLKKSGQGFVLMPLYPYSPTETLLSELEGFPPTKPDKKNIFGTDSSGRDVFARLCYAFNISITFALLVTIISYIIGIAIGSAFGYFGGLVDILGQRAMEIFSALPYLYSIMIINSFIKPRNMVEGVAILATITVVIQGWINITYYMRGEFLREKKKDYVSAMYAMGASNSRIMFRQILPNAITPIITFFPFNILAQINALVALDYLGYGLPPPTPSWGELLSQGSKDITKWWLIAAPSISMFLTLVAVVFIGEAVREAFDPKEYSRIR